MKNKEAVLVSTLLPQVHVGRLLRVVHSFVVCSAESRSRSIRVEVGVVEVHFGTCTYIHVFGSLFYVLYPGTYIHIPLVYMY